MEKGERGGLIIGLVLMGVAMILGAVSQSLAVFFLTYLVIGWYNWFLMRDAYNGGVIFLWFICLFSNRVAGWCAINKGILSNDEVDGFVLEIEELNDLLHELEYAEILEKQKKTVKKTAKKIRKASKRV